MRIIQLRNLIESLTQYEKDLKDLKAFDDSSYWRLVRETHGIIYDGQGMCFIEDEGKFTYFLLKYT